MSAFRFVEVEKAVFPMSTMCRVLGVSSSGAPEHRLSGAERTGASQADG